MLISLTVCFKDPYWIGIFEKYDEGLYSVSKITFGPEPSGPEIYEMIINNYYKLSFSTSIPLEDSFVRHTRINPKRLKREINRELREKSNSTKAQDAIKQEYEKQKLERMASSKLKKEQLKQEKFELRLKKKKEKLKGH